MSDSNMNAPAALHRFSKPGKNRGSVLPGKGAKEECECTTRIFDVATQRCGEPILWGALYVCAPLVPCHELHRLVPRHEPRAFPRAFSTFRCGCMHDTVLCMYVRADRRAQFAHSRGRVYAAQRTVQEQTWKHK